MQKGHPIAVCCQTTFEACYTCFSAILCERPVGQTPRWSSSAVGRLLGQVRLARGLADEVGFRQPHIEVWNRVELGKTRAANDFIITRDHSDTRGWPRGYGHGRFLVTVCKKKLKIFFLKYCV